MTTYSLDPGKGKCDVLLAHDWGGGIGWELVIQHPEMVGRFIPMNCPHQAAFISVFLTDYKQILRSWSVGIRFNSRFINSFSPFSYLLQVHDLLPVARHSRKGVDGLWRLVLSMDVSTTALCSSSWSIRRARKKGLSGSLSAFE